jgi:RNA polymerase sigma factor (sigma-70 family)
MPIRVSIVEDDIGVQIALKGILSCAPSLTFVGAYGSAEQAYVSIVSDPPDVVLMDINLPGKSGIQLVKELKAKLPQLLVMMMTVYEDGDRIFASLQAGASGYMLKRSEQPEEIIQSIEQLAQGGSPMSPDVARKVVSFFQQRKAINDELARLTPREHEVLTELSKGYRYKEIADRLKIGVETVRTHIQKIYEKLHVESRTEAVVKFMQNTSS